MTSILERDDLERRLTVMLNDRAAAVEIHSDPDAAISQPSTASSSRPRRRWMLAAAATIVVLAIGLLALASARDPDSVQTDTVPSTPAPSTVFLPVDSSPATLPTDTTPAPIPFTTAEATTAFAAAIEASGVLTSPSPEEVAQALDGTLYAPDTGETDVSGTGNYVSLRTCRFTTWTVDNFEPSPRCPDGFPAGWAFEAGSAAGVEIHHGLLGEAKNLNVSALNDRYFLVMERAPDVQAAATAWLIDAVSGASGPLDWRDTPTTLRSPEQALWVCDDDSSCLLPQVVDARHGTIQPLAVPDEAAARLPAQSARGRIWISTQLHGDQLWLAYSDDGGATWTDVALPEQMRSSSDEGFSIAADGDHVAATLGWVPTPEGRTVFVSSDAGRNWTTAMPRSDPGDSNLARLSVLADGRLVLKWSIDAHPKQVLVSTGSDWTVLDRVDALFGDPAADSGWRRFSVNQAGVALSTWTFSPCELADATCRDPLAEADRELDVTTHFSTDLSNWSTIDSPHE
jgi:hypothetical protein